MCADTSGHEMALAQAEAMIERQADEIARLRAQAQHESDCAEAYKTEADRLRDENAKLRADAERYRWLKSMASEQDDTYIVFPEIDAWDYQPGPQLNDKFATLDAAIDAAMQKGE